MTMPDSTLPDPEVYVQHGSRYYYSAEQMHAYAAAYLEAALARGIVTPTGANPAGMSAEGIEPGAAGTRPEAMTPQPVAPEGEALTDTFVQKVPDKCDRIVWRNAYYSLPIAPPSPQAAVATAEDFDAWHENPYTKVLQKSISEDYVPRVDADRLRAALERIAAMQSEYDLATQADKIAIAALRGEAGRS